MKPFKLVFVGPECSGKTSLSRQLAKDLNALWVPEVARAHLEQKQDSMGCYEDLVPLAEQQMDLEEAQVNQAQQSNIAGVVIDTHLLMHVLWGEVVFAQVPEAIEAAARHRHYDCTVLLPPDLPWQNDGIRAYPEAHQRWQLYQRHVAHLQRWQVPFLCFPTFAESLNGAAKEPSAYQEFAGVEDFASRYRRLCLWLLQQAPMAMKPWLAPAAQRFAVPT